MTKTKSVLVDRLTPEELSLAICRTAEQIPAGIVASTDGTKSPMGWWVWKSGAWTPIDVVNDSRTTLFMINELIFQTGISFGYDIGAIIVRGGSEASGIFFSRRSTLGHSVAEVFHHFLKTEKKLKTA